MVRTRDQLIKWKLEKAAKGRELRHRIDAYCISCIYDDALRVNWVSQVDSCGCDDCPLYDIRVRSRAEHSDVNQPASEGIPA